MAERMRNPLSSRILDSRILRTWEYPLNPTDYNGNEDPGVHIEHFDNQLDYYHVEGLVK